MNFDFIFFGVALLLSSSFLINFQFYQFNKLLHNNHPEPWEKFGFGNKDVNFLVKLKRIREFAFDYESSDKEMANSFKNINFAYWLGVISLGVILIGVGIELYPILFKGS